MPKKSSPEEKFHFVDKFGKFDLCQNKSDSKYLLRGERCYNKIADEKVTTLCHPNLAIFHSLEQSEDETKTYVFYEYNQGSVTLPTFVKTNKCDRHKIMEGIYEALRYLYSQNLFIRNLCPSSIMIDEHQNPIIFDLRFVAEIGSNEYPEPNEKDFDFFKKYFIGSDEDVYKHCLKVVILNLFPEYVGKEEPYINGTKNVSKECNNFTDQLECIRTLLERREEDDKLKQEITEANYDDAVEQLFSFYSEVPTPLAFKADEKQYISLKNKMKGIFRSHSAVFVKTSLLKPYVQGFNDPIGSPPLNFSSSDSSSSFNSLSQLSSPTFTSSKGISSSYSTSTLTQSSSQLSVAGPSLSSPSGSLSYSSSNSPTKTCKKGKGAKGKKSERRQEPRHNNVNAITSNGSHISISNCGPEFMQKIDSNDQTLRTYSFATGLFEVDGKLVPMRTANFCIQETLRAGNESTVLATLEAEFFVVLCTCLYDKHSDLTVTLSYSKDHKLQKKKFNEFVRSEGEYAEFVKGFESELLRSELKELCSALSKINFFSGLSVKKFFFDPSKPDFPHTGLFVQVTNSHESLIAEGKCEILNGNTVNLNFRIFIDKMLHESGACTALTGDKTLLSPERGRDPIVIASDTGAPKCCFCRKEFSKVCIIIRSKDEEYKSLFVAYSLWNKGFEVSFQCDNVKIHDPFTKDSTLGWSIIVHEDGSISMMKKLKYKAEPVKVDIGDDSEKCIDIIERTTCEDEDDVISSLLIKVDMEVIEVHKFIKKPKKPKKSKSKKTSKSSSSSKLESSFSTSGWGRREGGGRRSGSAGGAGEKNVLDDEMKKAIKDYYTKSLGEFAKQYPSVKIVVMEEIDFNDIVTPLFTDGVEEIYTPYKNLFSTLWELKKANPLVVLVNYNGKKEAEERYDNSLVLTPENLMYIKKKYRNKEPPKSFLALFSSSSSLGSSTSASESSLSGKPSSSSLSLQNFSKSTPSLSEGSKSQGRAEEEGKQEHTKKKKEGKRKKGKKKK